MHNNSITLHLLPSNYKLTNIPRIFYDPHNYTMKKVLLFFPFYRWANSFKKVKWLAQGRVMVYGRTEIQTLHHLSPKPKFSTIVLYWFPLFLKALTKLRATEKDDKIHTNWINLQECHSMVQGLLNNRFIVIFPQHLPSKVGLDSLCSLLEWFVDLALTIWGLWNESPWFALALVLKTICNHINGPLSVCSSTYKETKWLAADHTTG